MWLCPCLSAVRVLAVPQPSKPSAWNQDMALCIAGGQYQAVHSDDAGSTAAQALPGLRADAQRLPAPPSTKGAAVGAVGAGSAAGAARPGTVVKKGSPPWYGCDAHTQLADSKARGRKAGTVTGPVAATSTEWKGWLP